MHEILPVPGKGSGQWDYAWVPVAGPIAGAVPVALTYKLLLGGLNLGLQDWLYIEASVFEYEIS